MKNRSTFFFLFLVLVLWGSAFPAIRAALVHYPPTHLASLRFLIASLALGLVVSTKKFPLLERRDIPTILFNGVVGVGCYNLFLNRGQLSVEAGAASLLVNTAPMWTLLWAILFLNERPTWRGYAGLLISFWGVILITMRHDHHFEINKGALLVLGASIAHSIYIVLMKKNVARFGALFATTFAVWVGTAFLFLFSSGLVTTIQTVPWTSTLTVVYLGLFPAAAAYVLWGVILERFPASQAVSFLYFVPVTAFLIAWMWLGEKPTWNTLLGGLLILAGVALVNKTHAK